MVGCRRQTLVHIGNATGAYKAIIKYVGGVPQVLLDFIKTGTRQLLARKFVASLAPLSY